MSLTITDQYGCSDDTLFNDYLIVGGPSGEPQFTYDTCSQTASFFITNPNNISDAFWDLDDNTTDTLLSFEHFYISEGTYSPNVTLIDAAGCAVVYPINPAITVTNLNGLNANFSATPNPVNINTPVTFTDQSSTSGPPIEEWYWNFGNGQTHDGQNPQLLK